MLAPNASGAAMPAAKYPGIAPADSAPSRYDDVVTKSARRLIDGWRQARSRPAAWHACTTPFGAGDPAALPSRAAHLDPGRRDGRHRGLPPHLDEPLDRRDRREHEHDPQDRDQQRLEQQADADRDDSLGALHEPTLGVDPERLGLGPLIADQGTHRGHGERQ